MEMSGGFFATDTNGYTVTADTATNIDFSFFGFDMFRVINADRDFSHLTGAIGSITDFQFDPFVASIQDFWTVGTFAFELTDVTRGVTNDPVNFLVLDGVGVLSGTDYADTDATWTFSGDTSGTGIFSWSATSTETETESLSTTLASIRSVPEPSIIFLISIGLIGFRLRNKNKFNNKV